MTVVTRGRATTAAATEEIRFVVTYDGPAVDAGRMDAQTLGAAMMAMAQLVDAGAGLQYGARRSVTTEVTADFKQGSFSFAVIAALDWSGAADALLKTATLKDLLEALGVVGGGGLIAAVKWLRNRPVTKVEPRPDGQAVVTAEGGETTIVHAQTAIFLQNSTVRGALHGVVAPLRMDGIEHLLTGVQGEARLGEVTAREVDLFDPPLPSGEQLKDQVTAEIIAVAGLSFEKGKKWRFRLADGTPFSSALDDAFAARVARHEVTFGAGDALDVELRTIVVRDGDGTLHAARTIQRVLRLLPPPKQLHLELPGLAESPPPPPSAPTPRALESGKKKKGKKRRGR